MVLGKRGSRSFFTEAQVKWEIIRISGFKLYLFSILWRGPCIGKRKASLCVEGSFHFKAMYGRDKSFFCNVSFLKTGRGKQRSVCFVMAHSISLLLDTEHRAFTKISQIDTW